MTKFFGEAAILLAIAALISLSVPALAQQEQTYPNKAIRILVPWPPGSSIDILARSVGQRMSESFGVPTIVDNRPGASGVIGAQALLKAPPDGYTIMAMTSTHIISPLLKPTSFDAVKDFAPVATLDRSEFILVVHPSLPANNLKEFIALAKSKPGKLNYGSVGNGSSTHLATELLSLTAGIKMQHVPYKGLPQANADLVGGQLQVVLSAPSSTMALIKSGKIKAIAISGENRLRELPNVPTFVEAGLPSYDAKSWHGVLAPLGTPRPIINKLSAEVARILALPAVIENLARQGLAPFISTPEQFAELMASETAKLVNVIKAANITAD